MRERVRHRGSEEDLLGTFDAVEEAVVKSLCLQVVVGSRVALAGQEAVMELMVDLCLVRGVQVAIVDVDYALVQRVLQPAASPELLALPPSILRGFLRKGWSEKRLAAAGAGGAGGGGAGGGGVLITDHAAILCPAIAHVGPVFVGEEREVSLCEGFESVGVFWKGQADHLSVAQRAVVGDSLQVVVAHPLGLRALLSTRIGSQTLENMKERPAQRGYREGQRRGRGATVICESCLPSTFRSVSTISCCTCQKQPAPNAGAELRGPASARQERAEASATLEPFDSNDSFEPSRLAKWEEEEEQEELVARRTIRGRRRRRRGSIY
eukprot:scaffold4706_cov109-Ochromonas_danica.AAC.1